MTIEKPSNWRPPDINYHGVNLQDLFTNMLVEQVVTIMCAEYNDFNIPIANGIENLLVNSSKAYEFLNENGVYFHPLGSIYTDYKIMKSDAFKKIGQIMGKNDPRLAEEAGNFFILKQFRPNMIIDEAMQLAHKIVASWDWNN